LIDGIRWRTRVGAPWRDVPSCYGPWSSGLPVFRLPPPMRQTPQGFGLFGDIRPIFLGLLSHKLDTRAGVLVEGTARADVRQGLNLILVVKWTAIEELADLMCAAAGIDRNAPAVPSVGDGRGTGEGAARWSTSLDDHSLICRSGDDTGGAVRRPTHRALHQVTVSDRMIA
jgi:hypothetical protein